MKNIKKIHKTVFRLFKMVHDEDSGILPLYLLDIALSLVQVYAGLFLTAGLIDTLLSGDYEKAAWQALLLLGANLFFSLSIQLIKRRFEGMRTKVSLAFYVWLRRKAFSLDYETMENPKVAEKLLFSERTTELYGGVRTLLFQYSGLLKAVLNILLSVLMVAGLCLSKPGEGAGVLGTLAKPLPSALLFAAVLTGMTACAADIFKKFAEKHKLIFESARDNEEKLEYLIMRLLGDTKAIKIIRIYDMAKMLLHNMKQFDQKNRVRYVATWKLWRKEGNANAGVNLFFSVFAYLLVALKVVTRAVSVGAFTRYVGALNQFGSSCLTIISKQGDLQRTCTYMEDFLAFLDTENHHTGGTIPVEKRTDGEYELAFEHVTFCYPGSQEAVLKDINCRIRIGGKLAVVGRNGAGKTTFIKLLCRLYEPTEGRITLNGVDIRKYDESEYYSLFGVVFQDFKLFSFPVWENITAGCEREDDRIWEALRQADAEEMVRGMEKQLDTRLYKGMGNGVEISGGEAQKLALARALYKDAPVVILDEPTAALDPKAEAEVYARFNEMVEGRTSIYISHRMSSCRFCDDIIVFDEGQIVERGSHEELFQAGGHYAGMWNAQAKYYNENQGTST